MNRHRFILEPYRNMSSRYDCPECGKKTFARYIDTTTSQHLDGRVGRCNRESKCGYHYTPKQYFQDNNWEASPPPPQARPKAAPLKPSFIDFDTFRASLAGHRQNNFVRFLVGLFGADIARQLVERYYIGTSKYWDGACVFWQIDTKGRVHAGKIMLYNPTTGKRVKEPYDKITWVHKALKLPNFGLKQCFLGEHLLRDNTKPVALVESEKTAVIASVYFPGMIWLATGSLNNLNATRCVPLAGRKVVLFPDLKGFDKWQARVKSFEGLASFRVSNLLEQAATETERQAGLDLADYLIRFDYREFSGQQHPTPTGTREQKPANLPAEETALPLEEIKVPDSWPGTWLRPATNRQGNWQAEVTELKQYFQGAALPAQPVQLFPEALITDSRLFVDSHLSIIEANNGKPTFRPYLERLQALKEFLTKNQN